ncbi:aldo/keto reductase [Streptomyces sp. NPDC058770]|uniref:aldo/keto reductase n=1 Tax=Streptomyces sp. NPDC058770 TaxID=3346631 RepID=UPI003692FA3F
MSGTSASGVVVSHRRSASTPSSALDSKAPDAAPSSTANHGRGRKIRHIGLDTLTADQLEQALSLTGIASVQNRFNLLDRSSDAVLRVCEAHGLAFLPWFPLADGALTGEAGAALTGVADRHGATRGQIALAWLLHRSPVLCPTPGTGSPVHLTENMGAREVRLSAEDMSLLEGLASPRRTRPA